MKSQQARWLAGFGVVVLVGGLAIGIGGSGVTRADDDDRGKNPFALILKKLDRILERLNDGGRQDGNHTLRWDQNLPTAQRFVMLAPFANAAILDKETGLVWEQSPATTAHIWNNARFHCVNRTIGGRNGWRTPSVHELNSLVDPSVPGVGPTLPPGHPFTDVLPSAAYWSATSAPGFVDGAWLVPFNGGDVGVSGKTNASQIWCVRGGHNNGSQY